MNIRIVYQDVGRKIILNFNNFNQEKIRKILSTYEILELNIFKVNEQKVEKAVNKVQEVTPKPKKSKKSKISKSNTKTILKIKNDYKYEVNYFYLEELKESQMRIIENEITKSQLLCFKSIANSSGKTVGKKLGYILRYLNFSSDKTYFSITLDAIRKYKSGDDLDSVVEKVQQDNPWINKTQVSFYLVFGIKKFLKENDWELKPIEFIELVRCLLKKEGYK